MKIKPNVELYIWTNGKQVAKQTISELNKANVNGWETAKSNFLA